MEIQPLHVTRQDKFMEICPLNLLGKSRLKWVNNIKMNHRELLFGSVDWIYLAQARDWWQILVNTVVNFLVS
jgi:hypothetical protein